MALADAGDRSAGALERGYLYDLRGRPRGPRLGGWLARRSDGGV
ncbi:hypothetical protein DB30_03404 [Enhygromyxa salina]|uniref:Uncharacterized protein n=1 Tax=Enhygromyxa salina TaxID=215803 RepID=A0A0C2DCA7_9BACT|nr:hypothetical protein DB30_03404 [Enhygromyxa salina]